VAEPALQNGKIFSGPSNAASCSARGMHAHQLSVVVETVRELIASQFPEWSGLPITEFASQGTVNAVFRVGDQLAARFPLQPAGVDETRRLLESEAAAARELLGRTPFATPEPVAIGDPGAGFPLPWSVQTWLRGTTATETCVAAVANR
jgi:aminoglycoside phosphotransferase (APT) family kinase protein